MFDPTVGRWLTEDPIGFEAGDANKYRYVGNSPTNYTDPTGLAPWDMPLKSVTSFGTQVDPKQIGGGVVKVDGKTLGVVSFYSGAKIEIPSLKEKHTGMFIGYSGDRSKDVQFLQVFYVTGYANTKGGQSHILENGKGVPIPLSVIGPIELSGKNRVSYVDSGYSYTGRGQIATMFAGGVLGPTGTLGTNMLMGIGPVLRSQDPTDGAVLRMPNPPIESAFYFDAPQVSLWYLSFVNEDEILKQYPDTVELEFITHFENYLIIDNKPVYKVEWEDRARKKIGANLGGINTFDPVGGGSVTGLSAWAKQALKTHSPAQTLVPID